MKISGKNSVVGTNEEDIISAGGTLLLPTAARVHTIVSNSEDDDSTGDYQVETATAAGTIAGQYQVETATVAGTIDATLQVETATVAGTIVGQNQVETATVVGAIDAEYQVETATVAGTIDAQYQIETANVVGTIDAQYQIETATVEGAIDASYQIETATVVGNIEGATQIETATIVGTIDGQVQIETATVVGTIDPAGAGNASVVVTGAIVAGSPLETVVAVANNDTAAQVAGKMRTALNGVAAITNYYVVTGTGADIVLTAKAIADNDASLNIATDNKTCSGLTTEATSVDTQAGISGAGNMTVTVTSALIPGGLIKSVTVADNDTASQVADKVKTALGTEAGITTNYDISGTGADVVLTAKVIADNDATLNIAYTNDTCSGLTPGATSVDTRAGVSGAGNVTLIVTGALVAGTPLTIPVAVLDNDTAAVVAGKLRTAMNIAAITTNYTVGGSDTNIILTAKAYADNDATLNIDIDNGTCSGLTPAHTSTDTQAGASGAGNAKVIVTGASVGSSPKTFSVAVADGDSATVVAGKIRTALNTADITTNYDLTGSGADIVLIRKAYAANDATLNIDIDNDTCSGLVTKHTSTDTQEGKNGGGFAKVIVTGALVAGTPLTIQAAVVATDNASTVAGKLRTAMNIAAVTTNYDISGTGTEIILTTKAYAVNDTSLNIATDNDTCTGLTPEPTSVDTQVGKSGTGNATVIVTGNLVGSSPKTFSVAVVATDDASTVAGKIRTALNVADITTNYTIGGSGADITLTTKAYAVDDTTLNIDIDNGTCSGLTPAHTSVDTNPGVSGAGFAKVVVTGALVLGSPLTIQAAVAAADDASTVAGKLRTAMNVIAITNNYTISGSGADIVLTANTKAINDASLNIATNNDTCTGLTSEPTSVNTTAGIAGTGNATVIVTGALVSGSPRTISVPVVLADDASAIAGKIRTALNISAITDNYTVSGATDKVILTTKAYRPNDTTLNIDVADGTCNGIVAAHTSADTTPGASGTGDASVTVTSSLFGGTPAVISVPVLAADDASAVAGKMRTALNVAPITTHYTVSGATDKIILTAKVKAINDTTLNIAIDNDTCSGLSPAPTSSNTTPGVAGTGNAKVIITSAIMSESPLTVLVPVALGDTADVWAGRVRAALGATTSITDHYSVSGTTNKIVLTANEYAANDTTLNIDLDNDTSAGITPAHTSTHTTPGVLSSGTGAHIIEVAGNDVNNVLTYERVSLEGTTGVNTTNSFISINSMRVVTAGSGGCNAGKITATALVDSTVTSQIEIGENVSAQAVYFGNPVSERVVNNLYVDATNASSTAITTVSYYTKKLNGLWVKGASLQLTADSPRFESDDFIPTLAKNEAIKFSAVASTGSSAVNVNFDVI